MTKEYERHQYLTTEANVEFTRMVGRVRRLHHRCRLLEKQVGILYDALYSLVNVTETKTMLDHIRTLRDIARRYDDEQPDENGGE